jgi:AAA domain
VTVDTAHEPVFTFDHGVASVHWADLAIELIFERIHEDWRSHEMSAEVTYLELSDGGPTPLHRARLNLGSTTARATAVKHLGTLHQGVDWNLLLERAAWKVVDAVREGLPAILLRDAVAPEHERFLLKPIALYGDSVITFGDSGSMKSYLAIAGAASIHTGRPLLAGLIPASTMRVGIFDWEWKPAPHKRRLQALCGPGPLPDITYVPCLAAGPLAHQVDRLRRIIDQHGIEYGIFDSVGLACAGSPEETASALEFFQALANLDLKGSWLLAHVNRAGDVQRPFGSTFWQASARSTWFVKKTIELETRVDLNLTQRKMNDGPRLAPLGVRFEFDSGGVTASCIQASDESARATRSGSETAVDRIAASLRGRPLQTYEELAAELALSESTVRQKVNAHKGTLFEILPPKPGGRKKRLRVKDQI